MEIYPFDEVYVRRLAEGDAEVGGHFASYFGDLLYLKLRARLQSVQLIDDIRQETLLRVLQILRTKGGVEHPERFGAFVNAVCNNVMMEMCRSESRIEAMGENQEEPEDTKVNLDAPLISADARRQVRRVLDELPEKDRDILVAVYLEELELSEVCQKYQVNAAYLSVRLRRARERIRAAYSRDWGYEPAFAHAGRGRAPKPSQGERPPPLDRERGNR